ncbi:MAG TPA: hypothetical protein PK299_15765 [Anaerolineales bacterium]|nr:hypothetical protein [Anaerolineales bacterium]
MKIFRFLQFGLLVAFLGFIFASRVTHLHSFPNGISNDEATNLLDAHNAWQAKVLPFFYNDFEEPEPIYRTLLTFWVGFAGSSTFAARYFSVLLSMLGIASIYWASVVTAKELGMGGWWKHSLGLFSMSVLAGSMGYFVLSRSLYRAIPTALFLYVGIALILPSNQKNHVRWGLSAIALGLVCYTYTSGLFVIPVVFLVWVWKWLFAWKKNASRFALTFGGGYFLVLLPLLFVLLTQPSRVLARAQDVNKEQNEPLPSRIYALSQQLPTSIYQSLFVAGDPNPQYNAHYQPILPKSFSILFLFGLLVCVWFWRKPLLPLLVLGVVFGHLPVLLAGEDPHGLRDILMILFSPLVLTCGVAGLYFVVQKLSSAQWIVTMLTLFDMGQIRAFFFREKHQHSPAPNPTQRLNSGTKFANGLAWVTFGLTLVWGWRNVQATTQNYLAYWQNLPSTPIYGLNLPMDQWFFRADLKQFANYLAEQNAPVLVPRSSITSKTTRVHLLPKYPVIESWQNLADIDLPKEAQVAWFVSFDSPEPYLPTNEWALLQNGKIYLLPVLSNDAYHSLQSTLLATTPQPIDVEYRQSLFTAQIPLAIADFQFPTSTTDHTWEGELRVDGYSFQLTNEQTAYMALNIRQADDFTYHESPISLGWLSVEGSRVAGMDSQSFRGILPQWGWRSKNYWLPFSFQIPNDLPSGYYQLAVGVQGDWRTLDWIAWKTEVFTAPNEPLKDLWLVSNAIQLEGFDISREASQTLVSLYWLTRQKVRWDGVIFVHLLDGNGDVVGQYDAKPLGGNYPTYGWESGERVRTDFSIPHNTDAKPTAIRLGVYTYPDVKPFPISKNGVTLSENFIMLALGR